MSNVAIVGNSMPNHKTIKKILKLKPRTKGVSRMAGTVPQQINWFRDYPQYACQMVEHTIAVVIASRMLYPFTPTVVEPTATGFRAW